MADLRKLKDEAAKAVQRGKYRRAAELYLEAASAEREDPLPRPPGLEAPARTVEPMYGGSDLAMSAGTGSRVAPLPRGTPADTLRRGPDIEILPSVVDEDAGFPGLPAFDDLTDAARGAPAF